jgi:hypothetical protein
VAAAVGEQRERRRLEHSNGPHEPVSAVVPPLAARSVEQLVALDPERGVELERLDRRVQRVRHPDVDAGRPVAAAGRALAAPEGLVVRPSRRPDHEVVHRPLALRRHVRGLCEREQHGVGDALARLGVPGDDGGRVLRVQKRALRRADFESREQAVVDGNVRTERHLHGEDARGAGDGEWRIHVRGDRG